MKKLMKKITSIPVFITFTLLILMGMILVRYLDYELMSKLPNSEDTGYKVIFESLKLFFEVFTFLFLLVQIAHSKKSLDIQNQQMIDQKKAILVIEPSRIANDANIIISIINVGLVPAFNVSVCLEGTNDDKYNKSLLVFKVKKDEGYAKSSLVTLLPNEKLSSMLPGSIFDKATVNVKCFYNDALHRDYYQQEVEEYTLYPKK